jgi:hypothetical protein
MKTVEYILPSFWASALVNGDESGLSDEEIDAIDAWLNHMNLGSCVDVSSEEFFSSQHDARFYVLPCDCLEFTFIKP